MILCKLNGKYLPVVCVKKSTRWLSLSCLSRLFVSDCYLSLELANFKLSSTGVTATATTTPLTILSGATWASRGVFLLLMLARMNLGLFPSGVLRCHLLGHFYLLDTALYPILICCFWADQLALCKTYMLRLAGIALRWLTTSITARLGPSGLIHYVNTILIRLIILCIGHFIIPTPTHFASHAALISN